MTLSTKYASATIVLLTLALVPTAIHGYLGRRIDDGLRAAAVSETLAGLRSMPGKRTDLWVDRRFDSTDWVERYYGPGEHLRLFVIRTYDPKRVYHHPELAVSYHEAKFRPGDVVRLAGAPDVPVHALHGQEGHADLVLYALHYGDSFVRNPILFQLGLSGRLLFEGRRPMTLFYVHDSAPAAGAPVAEQPAARLLVAAIESFLRQKPVPPPGAEGPAPRSPE
jgi:hypothetical protein